MFPKRSFIATIVLLFSILQATKAFDGGYTFGLNMSQIDGDGWSGYSKLGLAAGGFITMPFKNGLNGQVELRFVQKGARSTYNPKTVDYEKIRLDYLEMPITLNYQLKKYDFKIESGLLVGKLIRSVRKDHYGKIPGGIPAGTYHNYDLGFIVGTQFELNKHMWFDIRYTYSLVRIRKIEVPQYGWWWYYRGDYHNVLNASIFYKF